MKLAELKALAEARADGNRAGNQLKQGCPRVETRISGRSRVAPRDEIRPTWAEVEIEAGDDWPLIKNDRESLFAFRQALITRRMIERGEVPEHYTGSTNCKRCGLVPIFEGCTSEVQGCPWCFNRIRGFPIPRVNRREKL